MSDIVSVERFIPAAASEIFDLIADPSRHKDIDGSGTVRDARGTTERLRMGSTFGMSMKMGVPYAMESTVIEFEEDRRLAWQTRGPTFIGKLVGGRVWRYELEPGEGGTLVRETWDLTDESPATKWGARRAEKATAKNMAATLERIEQLLT